jgi:hypothetical protein
MSLGLWFTVKSSDGIMDGYKAIINSQEDIIKSLEELYALRSNMYEAVKKRNEVLETFTNNIGQIVKKADENN